MAFTDDLNNVSPASQAVAIYDLKEAMKTAGYTVVGSGDGIAAHSAVGDIITQSGSGANGMDNADAWFTVQQGAGGTAPFSGTRQWTFQRGAQSYSWACEYSGPDTTFDQSTGTATVRPTGVVPGDIKPFTSASGFQTVFPTTLNFTYQIRVGNSAENFHWYLIGYPNGGGNTNVHLCFIPLDSNTITATEDEPFLLSANNGNLLFTSIGNKTTGNVFGWQGKNGTVNAYALISAFAFSDSSGFVSPAVLGTSPVELKDNDLPIFWGRINTSTQPGFKGGSSIVKWKGSPRVTADLAEASTKIVFDDTVWSWDGSTTPSV
jgi:hypothetical protein